MKELLVIKAGNNYYRFDGDSYLPCEFSKASVFPLNKVESVGKLCTTLREDGVEAVLIKLTISEEKYPTDKC